MNTPWRFLVLLAILGINLMPGTARADYLTGWQAIADGDYAAARTAWLESAYAGDIDLQFNIGRLHESGLLGQTDPEAALRWYRSAAARGLPAAQDRLAGLALNGLGMEPDPELAAELLIKAAEAGFAPAQNNLAIAYELGLHVPVDADLASLWYHRAAMQGLPEAQYGLARLLLMGASGGNDPAQALGWYRAAAEAGLVEAENNLALMYEQGSGVTKDLAAAVVWYRRAAEKGLAVAQNNLGIMLQYGRGIEVNPVAAAIWFQAAALGGDPFGQINLANAYANGIGIDPDLTQAYAWILLARVSGDEAAHDTAAEYARRLAPRLEIEARRLAITRAQALRDEIATETIRRDARRFWLLPVEELGSPVAAAQRYLIVLGYLTGIVDGIAGPATNAAAQRFRRDNDLDTEIRIDTILIAALVEAAAAPVSKPSQTENTY